MGPRQLALVLQQERLMAPEPGVRWSEPDQESIVPEYRKTKTAGVYVRHQARCPAGSSDARCRCRPTYRGRRWDSSKQGMVWSATFGDRAEVLSWLASTIKGQEAVAEAEAAGPTFGELASEWLDGVHSGAVGRRRGRKGTGYSSTTLEGYERSLRYVLTPEFGAHHASEIDDREWQTWVDRLSREGLSRSRIANHLAVARAIYGWASRPTRRLVERNPLAGIELPPNDEKPRTRVADADEAAALIAALDPADAVPYALAFYAGLQASRDQATRLAGRRARRLPTRREEGQESSRHRPSAADRRAAAPDSPRRVHATGAAGERSRQRCLRDVGQDRRARPEARGPLWGSSRSPCTSAGTRMRAS